MRHRSVLSVLVFAPAIACSGKGAPVNDVAMKPGQVPTLRQLATAWSGGRTQPKCGHHGPNGEYPGPMGDQYCVWSTAAESPAGDEVGASATKSGHLLLLQWDRPTKGKADADRLVDSLRTALRSHNVIARDCPSGDVPAGHVELVEWNAPTLLIQLSRITPPAGAPRLTVMATDEPSAVPDVLCPREKTL